MNKQGQEWWERATLRPVFWLLDRALDGAFYIWNAIDDPNRGK